MSDVIGLGSAFVDYFFEVDREFLKKHRLNPEDDKLFKETDLTFASLSKEIPLVKKSPGSIAINTLAVLSRLGVKTTYLGVFGEDEAGDYLLKNRKDINLRRIIRRGSMSACACLVSNSGHSRAFLSELNKYDNDIISKLNPVKLNKAKFIFLSNYMYKADEAIKALQPLLKSIKPGKLIFTMSTFYAYFGLKRLSPLLNKTYCLFINQEEVKMLTKKEAREGSKELLKSGPQIVVCTLGKEGAFITTKDVQLFSPAKKVKRIVDSTGAGDTFTAGFIYGLIKNKSLEQSADFANKLAAKALSDYGLHWMKSAL